ncbi:MAG TPA: hypothetical protein VK548_24370 [Candidatus Acidoferrum sp.]|nr:hypothetical protein [Candidatus Acidoferrum sp.]
MIRRPFATTVFLVAAPATAWADHGGGLSRPGPHPIFTAFLWAGATLLAGLAVIAIVRLLSRRRAPRPPDA